MKAGDTTENGLVLSHRLMKSPHPSCVVDKDHPAWAYKHGGWDYEKDIKIIRT